jgi:hypothetical protein
MRSKGKNYKRMRKKEKKFNHINLNKQFIDMLEGDQDREAIKIGGKIVEDINTVEAEAEIEESIGEEEIAEAEAEAEEVIKEEETDQGASMEKGIKIDPNTQGMIKDKEVQVNNLVQFNLLILTDVSCKKIK